MPRPSYYLHHPNFLTPLLQGVPYALRQWWSRHTHRPLLIQADAARTAVLSRFPRLDCRAYYGPQVRREHARLHIEVAGTVEDLVAFRDLIEKAAFSAMSFARFPRKFSYFHSSPLELGFEWLPSEVPRLVPCDQSGYFVAMTRHWIAYVGTAGGTLPDFLRALETLPASSQWKAAHAIYMRAWEPYHAAKLAR